MKKIFYTLSMAAVMASCTSNPSQTDTGAKTILPADTAGLAQFQAWKVQNELKNPNTAYYVSNNAADEATRTSSPVRKTSKPKKAGNESGSMTTESQHAAKKKGWSKAAKGTAIGAGTGAVLGAVINKRNRVAGGIIGGVIGGGVGFGIGRSMDKKDGRY